MPFVLAAAVALPQDALAQAQTTPPAAPGAPITSRSLKVVSLTSNQGMMNDLQNKVMAPLVVLVLNQNDEPVEGALVLFRFPTEGPGATFAGGSSAQTFQTNADGQAAAVGWTANGKVGTFRVQVLASAGAERGTAVISMTNVTRITGAGRRTGQTHWWSTTWGKIAIGAVIAGAVAGAIVATRGSGGHTITVTPGSPSIGGPQ